MFFKRKNWEIYLFSKAFEDAFERDDNEDDPEALEDPLMKIDLLVWVHLKNSLSNWNK